MYFRNHNTTNNNNILYFQSENKTNARITMCFYSKLISLRPPENPIFREK